MTRKLIVRAEADFSHLSAAQREQAVLAAKRTADEKAAAAIATAEARAAAKAKIDAARAAGNVQRSELSALIKAEREAGRAAKQAAAEAKAARAELTSRQGRAARISRAESRAAPDSDQAFLDEMQARADQVRYETANRRKVAGPAAGPKKSFWRYDNSDGPGVDRSMLGEKFGKYAGPAALVTIAYQIVAKLTEFGEEIRALRRDMAAQTVKTGERSLGLSDKLRRAGVKGSDVSGVISKVQGRAGALSGDELTDLAEEALGKGMRTAKDINGYIEQSAARREQAGTPEEQAALLMRRINREREIRKGLAGREHVQSQAREELAKLERELTFGDQGGSAWGSMWAHANVALSKVTDAISMTSNLKQAGGEEQLFNYIYNKRVTEDGRSAQQITLRIDPAQFRELARRSPGAE